jgi:hypothetical protein
MKLYDAFEGWIDSLKDYPENYSIEGLKDYLCNGCNMTIDMPHEEMIKLYTPIREMINKGQIPGTHDWHELESAINEIEIKL